MKPSEVKEAGWYWARYSPGDGSNRWECVEVWGRDGDLACHGGYSGHCPPDFFQEFVGPIPDVDEVRAQRETKKRVEEMLNRIPRSLALYHVRVENDGQAFEVGFQTAAELAEYMEHHNESEYRSHQREDVSMSTDPRSTDPPDGFALRRTDVFTEHAKLQFRRHCLLIEGQDGTPEMKEIESRMNALWEQLTEEQRKMCQKEDGDLRDLRRRISKVSDQRRD